jgi:uncharacterized protein YbjT (DUF2867 family)
VGRAVLQGLLADDTVVAVHALGRRNPGLHHPKLTFHSVDFSALPALPAVHEVYLALGTTIKVAGSQSAFRAVDFDANFNVARAARAAGATRIGLVSAMGANSHSRIFYNRVKGELEGALTELAYERLVIARPSLLVGDRGALGQPERKGERLAMRLSDWLGPVIPDKLRAVRAEHVAQALLRAVPVARGNQLLVFDKTERKRQAAAP